VVVPAILALIAPTWLLVLPLHAATISYVYDELGRLVGVVDPAAGTAIYRYDPVGNLLSISRQAASVVSIIDFTPHRGPVGAAVTISGTGFSATTSQNSVAFNGVAAQVSAASATQIVAVVPPGAMTGSIRVSSPGGSAASSSAFVVTSEGAPRITGFTPAVGTAGVTLAAISGSDFAPAPASNKVFFNTSLAPVPSATSTTISATAPAGGTSGRITVITPAGTAVSGGDFFIPPAPYTAGDIEVTGRIAVGDSRAVALGSPGKIAVIVFDGAVGQRLSVGMSAVTIAATDVTVFRPDGSRFAALANLGPAGGVIDVPPLPVSGTYTILVDPQSTNTGSLTLALSQEITGTVAIDGPPATVSLANAGQNARVAFSGTSGQRLGLGISSVTIAQADVSVVGPGGSALLTPGLVDTTGNGIALAPLPATGTYTIIVNPRGVNTGTLVLTLSQELAASLTVDGPPLAMDLRPGQNARLAFSGLAGQRVGLGFTGVTNPGSDVSVLNPDGTTLVAATFVGTSGEAITPAPLPTTGAYAVLVDPRRINAGALTVTLSQDVVGAIAIGGPPVGLTLSRAGQNARLTFSGTATQPVTLQIAAGAAGSDVSILNPDGTTLAGPSFAGSSGGTVGQTTLPVSGTYTVVVDPRGINTGNMTLMLFDMSDVTGTIAIGGPDVTVSITRPGQKARLTFSGVTGQHVSLTAAAGAVGSDVSILKPDGTTLAPASFAGSTGGFIDQQALPATGTYTVLVTPRSTNTGSLTLTLIDATDVTGAIAIGGPAVTVAIPRAGQNARLTFGGVTGRLVSVQMAAGAVGSDVFILNPDGTVLAGPSFAGSTGGAIGQTTLPATGTYTVLINPRTTNTGSISVTLLDMSDVTGAIVIGGPDVAITIARANQNARLTFNGSVGQQVSLSIAAGAVGSDVSILNPDGTTLAPASFAGSTGGFIDQRTLPSTGEYTVLIDPRSTNTGSMTLALLDATDVTGSIAIGGPDVTVVIARPGQNSRLTFSGSAGKLVGLQMAAGAVGSDVFILNPEGTVLAGPSFAGSTGGSIGQTALPVTGTYTVLINPRTTNTGSISVTLLDMSDVTGTIAIGGPDVTVAIARANQNARLTFGGAAGQQVSVKVATGAVGSDVSILNSDGTTLAPPSFAGSTGGFIDQQTLPATGTYTVLVDPRSTNIGSATLTLIDATDVGGTIAIGDSTATVTIARPGQNVRLTFAANNGQQVSLRIGTGAVGSDVSILNPDGTTLAPVSFAGSSGGFIDQQTLPMSGTYTILINPRSTNTGSMALTLIDATDVTGTIAIGGPSVTVTIARLGQNARLSFNGTAGRQVSLLIGAGAVGSEMSILNPDGTSLVAPTAIDANGGVIDHRTLPSTGTYTIFVNPISTKSGTITLTLLDS
jgi:YD repeat-containing protein